MDFWEVINKRRSVRSFDPEKEVTQKQIDELLAAAKRAPSAGGVYPTDFVVIKEKEIRERLVEAASGQTFVAEAPVVIAIVINAEKTAARYGERGRNLYAIQDSAAAAENILLAATALGLGSCWVGAFDEEKVGEILELKEGLRPVALVVVGWEK